MGYSWISLAFMSLVNYKELDRELKNPVLFQYVLEKSKLRPWNEGMQACKWIAMGHPYCGCEFLPTVLKHCQKHLHLIAWILRFMPYKVVGCLAFDDILLTTLLSFSMNHPLGLLYASQTLAPVSIPIEQCGPFSRPMHRPDPRPHILRIYPLLLCCPVFYHSISFW